MFGAAAYSDLTKHKDPERQRGYIDRHKKNEEWAKSGIKTSGFWSKHILWNKPTVNKYIDDLTDKLNGVRLKVAREIGV